MNKVQTFQEYLATQGSPLPIPLFVFNLALAALLAAVLTFVFQRWSRTLSDRSGFAGNFVLITVTTMLVISIVKSSLALSLGLVGALSIIRFRTAIKEPEELAYLFLSIAIGLGFGANQGLITIVAFALVIGLIFLRYRLSGKKADEECLFLTVEGPSEVKADQLVDVLRKTCSNLRVKRLEETATNMEAVFLVRFKGFSELDQAKKAIRALNDQIKLAFLDYKGSV